MHLLYALFVFFPGKLLQGAGYLADKATVELLGLQNPEPVDGVATTTLPYTTLSPANESQLAGQRQKVNHNSSFNN